MMRIYMGDSSLRFLRYLLQVFPDSWCHVKANEIFPKSTSIFRYTCLKTESYKKRLEKYKLPFNIEYHYLESKKILPPSINQKKLEEIKKKMQDPSIKYIIFPLLIIKKDNVCGKKGDRKKHIVYLLLNKSRNIVEILDDCYGDIHTSFEMNELIQNAVDDMAVPIFAEMGYDKVTFSIFPKFLEQKYKTLHDILLSAGYPADYGNIYRLFLVNYIKYRVKNPLEKLTPSVTKALSLKSQSLLETYKRYRVVSEEYTKTHLSCNDILEVRNLETRNCVKADGDSGKSAQNIDTPCVANEYFTGKDCVRIKQYFMEKKGELEDHIFLHSSELIRFLINRHPHCALMPQNGFGNNDNKFIWEYNPKKRKWFLTPPVGLNEFVDKSMSNEKIRLIVFLIWIKNTKEGGQSHANAIIIDKKARTLERYEPNAPHFSKNLGNNERLDKAVCAYFSKYKFADCVYAVNTCPMSLHKMEWIELDLNIKTHGGNCGLWTMWYMNLRMTYPNVPRDELFKYAIQEIKKIGSFKHFINGFHVWLLRNVKSKRGVPRATS